MHQFDAYLDAHQERFVAELGALLRVPSVAARGTGISEAAGMVRDRLQRLGAEVRLLEAGGGNPVVYATIGQAPRRLLIYDHYDVQPAEPLEWMASSSEYSHTRAAPASPMILGVTRSVRAFQAG